MDTQLGHGLFEPLVGKQFSFDGHHVTLTLASVHANPRFAMPGADRVPFSLIFHGPASDILPEGFYHVSIEDGLTAEFHIMPIATTVSDRQEYQAVFN